MDELLQLLNKIQEVFSMINMKSGSKLLPFDLPQIVVIGAQSCGKSSILESLVGRSFLPRGPGVVTRRPLILQLIYSSKKELARVGHELSCSNLEAWGCFLHRPDRKYIRFDEMRQEIISETVRVAGEKQDISTEPIYLKIYSTSVNLTFIDLPGLIKMPVGDQPHDIEDKVRELVLQYISDPQSIILAVTPANTDITTSESLQLARQVDPKGIRTLAVITKLDLMDEGTDATDILSGRIISVRLGIYGVVNRSQRETQQGKAIAQALIDEATFFKIRYPKLAMHHGTPFLAKSLQHILIEQIRSFIPEIRSTIVSMSNHYKAILKSCGEPVFDKGQTILNIVTEYSTEFCSCIRGNSNDLDTSELCEGARISYIFQEMFGQTLDSLNPLAGFSKSKILTAMRNASGTCPALFIPETSFEVLVKRQIKTLEDPSIQCADLVYQELERVITNTARKCAKGLLRFTNLHRKILDISSDLIRSRLPDTHSTIRQLIEIQMAYINTNHPDFIKDAMYVSNWAHSTIIDEKHNLTPSDIYSENNIVHQPNDHGPGFIKNSNLHQALSQASIPTSVDSVVEPVNQNLNRQERENHDYIIIEELIKSYFHIVRKSIQDYVPKVIMHCLVNHVMDHIQQQLVTQLYQPDQFDDLLIESKQIFDKRKETSDTIKIFDKASEIINEIRDFHSLNANLRLW